jgi:putative endopeptidase
MVENLMTTFQERVDASTWLSADGKTAAKKKISTMRRCSFNSVSDGSSLPSSNPAYVSASKGGTLYENLVQYDLGYFAKNLAYLGSQENLESVSAMFPSLTPNAFYIVDDNSFTLELGYLASSAVSFQEMSPNTLAGTIGWVAGHEICHGFDSNGTNYDESGHYNLAWWNSADHAAFETIASKVSSFYDGYQQFPSFGMSGKLVLAEALADVGGLALTYDTLKKNSAFDAKAFFKAGAENFFMVTSHDLFAGAYAKDVHPYGRGRVNRAFSSFAPFQETYETSNKDFMYVAPESRITLW